MLGDEELSIELGAHRHPGPSVADIFAADTFPVSPFLAREEDLPAPGDYTIYENAGRTYILARQPDGSIRALHNVCD